MAGDISSSNSTASKPSGTSTSASKKPAPSSLKHSEPDRADTAITTPSASPVESVQVLASPEPADSDSGASRALVADQAEAAEGASGQGISRELMDYQQNVDELESLGEVGLFDPARSEAVDLSLAVTRVRDQTWGELVSVSQPVQEALDKVTWRSQIVAAAVTSDGPFMTEEQGVLFEAYASEYQTKALEELNQVSPAYVEKTRDPMTLAVVGDSTTEEQLAFFENSVRLLGSSPAGRERLGEVVDGLAGLSDDPMADLALTLRDGLEEGQLRQLDGDLGLMTGIDGQFRSEGYQERLAAITETLQIEPNAEHHFSEGEQAGMLTYAGVATGALEEMDRLPGLGGLQENGLLGQVTSVAEHAGALVGALDTIYQFQEGDIVAGGSGLVGLSGFALRNVAPKAAPVVGWIATGVGVTNEALDMLNDHMDFVDFRRGALEAAMPDDPLRHILWGGNPSSNGLSLRTDIPARDALMERADSILPGWQDLDPEMVKFEFWNLAT